MAVSRLASLFLITALVAASLGAYGVLGLIPAGCVLCVWIGVRRSPEPMRRSPIVFVLAIVAFVTFSSVLSTPPARVASRWANVGDLRAVARNWFGVDIPASVWKDARRQLLHGHEINKLGEGPSFCCRIVDLWPLTRAACRDGCFSRLPLY